MADANTNAVPMSAFDAGRVGDCMQLLPAGASLSTPDCGTAGTAGRARGAGRLRGTASARGKGVARHAQAGDQRRHHPS